MPQTGLRLTWDTEREDKMTALRKVPQRGLRFHIRVASHAHEYIDSICPIKSKKNGECFSIQYETSSYATKIFTRNHAVPVKAWCFDQGHVFKYLPDVPEDAARCRL